jgi:aminoglycoside 6'-N-acetyltransferase I
MTDFSGNFENNPDIHILPLNHTLVEMWISMRKLVRPETDVQQQLDEAYFLLEHTEKMNVFICKFKSGEPMGFIEVSVRDFAEGCLSSPVGYIEGWFVREEFRNSGIGRLLVLAAERWARTRGCIEIASDADVDNESSRKAHTKLGFEHVADISCFRKKL